VQKLYFYREHLVLLSLYYIPKVKKIYLTSATRYSKTVLVLTFLYALSLPDMFLEDNFSNSGKQEHIFLKAFQDIKLSVLL